MAAGSVLGEFFGGLSSMSLPMARLLPLVFLAALSVAAVLFALLAWRRAATQAEALLSARRSIAERERALARSRELADLQHSLLEGAAVALIETELSGNIVAVNRQAGDLFGCSAPELQRLRLADLVRESDGAPAGTADADADAGLASDRNCRCRRRDASVFHGRISTRPRYDADGEVCGHVHTLTDVTEQARQLARLESLAYHDTLTGLANRTNFLQRAADALQLARRHGRRMALIFIDLDCFKQVNDRNGHDAGDFVLRQVARRLRDGIRSADLICRYGGDEFVVLLTEVSGEAPSPLSKPAAPVVRLSA